MADPLEHRRHVRSLLALVRAIVRQSHPFAPTVPDFAAHLNGRLDALARAQELLMRPAGERVDLTDVLWDELLSQHVADSVDAPSPPLLLDRRAAASLVLPLHELATNAAKFGQLQQPGRRIQVRWMPSDDRPGWVVLRWEESSGQGRPPLPLRDGFGFELIRNLLPCETGARTAIDLTPEGLCCEITFDGGGTGAT